MNLLPELESPVTRQEKMATVWDEAEVSAGRVGAPGAGAGGRVGSGWGSQDLAWSWGQGRLGCGPGSRLLHSGFLGWEAEAVSGLGGRGILALS